MEGNAIHCAIDTADCSDNFHNINDDSNIKNLAVSFVYLLLSVHIGALYTSCVIICLVMTVFGGAKTRIMYLKITGGSFLLLFALDCEDPNCAQVIFDKSLYRFNSWHPGVSGEYFKLPNPFLKGLNRKWLNSRLKIKMLTVWFFFFLF